MKRAAPGTRAISHTSTDLLALLPLPGGPHRLARPSGEGWDGCHQPQPSDPTIGFAKETACALWPGQRARLSPRHRVPQPVPAAPVRHRVSSDVLLFMKNSSRQKAQRSY